MDHPKTFLLKKIVSYDKNGLESLGHLHAKHIDDLSKVLKEYAEATVMEVIEGLNKGKSIDMNGTIIYLDTKNKRKTTSNELF